MTFHASTTLTVALLFILSAVAFCVLTEPSRPSASAIIGE